MIKYLILFLFSINCFAGDYSFRSSKKMLKKFYKNYETFYCSCKLEGIKPKHNTCGYRWNKYIKRSKRIEIEHIVPAHRFGKNTTEWKIGTKACIKKGKMYKGRKCAVENKLFNQAYSDMNNLATVLGSLNAYRSNFKMRELVGEPRNFGRCDFEVDTKKRLSEPPENKKGDVARIYLYMAKQYPTLMTLSKEEIELYSYWSQKDKVDKAECIKARWVVKKQGLSNNYILKDCK